MPKSAAVATVQEWLNELGYRYRDKTGKLKMLVVDGVFGPNTEDVVESFQENEGLLADGIIGPNTLKALETAYYESVRERDSPVDSFLSETNFTLERIYSDKFDQGYNRFQLRNDVAEEYRNIRNEVITQGGILTSSGGIRSLNAKVNANRSAVSFHYVGRALDLFVYSGMVDPATDPYVIIQESNRYFRVFARCKKDWPVNSRDKPSSITLPAQTTLSNIVTYNDRLAKKTGKVTDHFLDLTAIFQKFGFERIRARKRFTKGGHELGAEWWHFQYEKGLMPKVSTFGDELLKIYNEDTLIGTPPWLQRERTFGINWF